MRRRLKLLVLTALAALAIASGSQPVVHQATQTLPGQFMADPGSGGGNGGHG